MGGTEDILFLVIFIICNGNSYQFIQNAEIHTIKKKKKNQMWEGEQSKNLPQWQWSMVQYEACHV